MALEIERKFLVSNNDWRGLVSATKHVCQAYLNRDGGFSARVRVVDTGHATLTLKSSRAGLSRLEFEYAIPLEDAEQLMAFGSGLTIEKTRHLVTIKDVDWEIDVFEGANAGLTLAEVELASEDQDLSLPSWIGAEVTEDSRFYNSNLSLFPFTSWQGRAADELSCD
ncbi:MAG: CYTH domain-containing protein [Hyphomicrobiaceae bacterium]